MQNIVLDNLSKVQKNISSAALSCNRKSSDIQLLIVTKTQSPETILPLLLNGQRLFGENRVQEALAKWPEFKSRFTHLQLHLIGHLQSNKVKEAVEFFDVIQTLDSIKLAEKLTNEEQRQKKQLNYYVEINLANEKQKSGISIKEANVFLKQVKENFPLNIIGLMCIPPVNENPTSYFHSLTELAQHHNLKHISMGMSNDYQIAICCGATLVRIGHAIFGA